MAPALLVLLTIPSIENANPTASPAGCPISFSVESPSSTQERRADAQVSLDNNTCMCEVFDNASSTPFTDVEHSYCGNIPQEWYGAYHITCPHCMGQGTVVNITCPNNWEACDLIVNLYVCPSCSSTGGQAFHGLWPSSLAADGWTAAGRCVPSFCTNTTGQHKFVGFHKQIMGGDTEILPDMQTEPTMYFSFIVKEASACSSITSDTECDAALSCRWGNATGLDRRAEQLSDGPGQCVQDWCPTTSVGPSGGCGNCPPGLPDGECSP